MPDTAHHEAIPADPGAHDPAGDGLPAPAHDLAGGQTKLYLGDSLDVLAKLPDHCVDVTVTSPPYWGLRNYAGQSTLGNEQTLADYIANLTAILTQVYRVTRPAGSLWLNLGDTYVGKRLQGVPWRVAFALEAAGWILRQEIIWDKQKGNPDNARDKLRVTHEHVFFLIKRIDDYYFDLDPVRTPPLPPTVRADGSVVTPTGVSGRSYRQQIDHNDQLTETEKDAALGALEAALAKVKTGAMPDFRMLIRGGQRSTHGDDPELSGRAREIQQNGFVVLPYHQKGSKPGSVWAITSEQGGKNRLDTHSAVYPERLCRIPILTCCPPGGVVLDPFVGSGTTCVAAHRLGRRSIGIDSSPVYLESARDRLSRLASDPSR